MITAQQARDNFQKFAKEFVNIPDFSMGVDIVEWKVRLFNLWVRGSRWELTNLACKNLALAFMNPKIGRVQQTTCVSFSKGWDEDLVFLVKKEFVELGLDNNSGIQFTHKGTSFKLDPVNVMDYPLGFFEPFQLDEKFEIQA